MTYKEHLLQDAPTEDTTPNPHYTNAKLVEGIYLAAIRIFGLTDTVMFIGTDFFSFGHIEDKIESKISRSSVEKLSDIDLADVLISAIEDCKEFKMKENKLPSQFQKGDRVQILFSQQVDHVQQPFSAEVLAVHFYAGKVKYDLEVPIINKPPTRIYNIDSCFVLPIAV